MSKVDFGVAPRRIGCGTSCTSIWLAAEGSIRVYMFSRCQATSLLTFLEPEIVVYSALGACPRAFVNAYFSLISGLNLHIFISYSLKLYLMQIHNVSDPHQRDQFGLPKLSSCQAPLPLIPQLSLSLLSLPSPFLD